MTTKTSRSRAAPATAATGFDPAAPMMAGLSDWARQLSACQAAWHQQWWGFVSARMSKDAALAQRLLTCKTPNDIARAYSDYFSQTITDYQNEVATLTRLGTEVSVASVPVAPNGHDFLAPQEMDMLGRLNA